MRLPNGEVILHAGQPYDPQKAHEYYLRTRKLTGRKKSASFQPGHATAAPPPASNSAVRARKKQELTVRIQGLEGKLKQLEAHIKAMEATAKKADKPDTAAEKSKKARDSKQYRDKHKTELRTKAKAASAKKSGGSKTASDDGGARQLASMKETATKIKGQIAVAKAKLRAL